MVAAAAAIDALDSMHKLDGMEAPMVGLQHSSHLTLHSLSFFASL
jgi:hypothetical protein